MSRGPYILCPNSHIFSVKYDDSYNYSRTKYFTSYKPYILIRYFFKQLGPYNYSSEPYIFLWCPVIFGPKPAPIIVFNQHMQQPIRVIAEIETKFQSYLIPSATCTWSVFLDHTLSLRPTFL